MSLFDRINKKELPENQGSESPDNVEEGLFGGGRVKLPRQPQDIKRQLGNMLADLKDVAMHLERTMEAAGEPENHRLRIFAREAVRFAHRVINKYWR